MSARRVPRWSELRPLLRPRPATLDPTERRLAGAASIADLRDLARRRAPHAVFDYADGGAGEEISLRRSRQSYAALEFRPRVLRDVSSIDTSAVILGRPTAVPFAFAPTGFTRMMHTEGERAVARVAARRGHSLRAVDDGHDVDRGGRRGCRRRQEWFQLYMWRDREASRDFVTRAAGRGYEALVLTVDIPIAGPRLRDVRNGFDDPAVADAEDLR